MKLTSQQKWKIFASSSMFLSVAMGAFGAHALKNYFIQHPDLKEIYHTAVLYQMIHSIGLLYCAQYVLGVHSLERWICRAMGMGIVFFSGSLYILVFTQVRLWGAVTPIGGVCFLLAWALLVWSFARQTQKSL